MIEGIPRISVLMITYNQENVIKRSIDSLLSQKDYIYEICVSDDCSKDKTWEILNNYSNNNPGLFKLNQNKPNLGIFENIEKTWDMPSGDIVYRLAGDDMCGQGWFCAVLEFINQKKINYREEMFCIYGDYQFIFPNGDTYTHHNTVLNHNEDVLRLALRGAITNRSTCFSRNILSKYEKLSQGRSYVVENIQDRQLQIHSRTNYYIPMVGNIYFCGIGVSSRKSEKIILEMEGIWPLTLDYLENKGISLCTKDLFFVKYSRKWQKFLHWGKYKDLMGALFYYILSIDFTMGGYKEMLRRNWFSFRRRIPHGRPIIMN